ncbi:SulP family inorganic anion transporter [Amphritea pacifica]|uniref:SulP family inorganic anion transporter n=1 Tax=Amphritea pacifica TaxID=2811233 RepID=UPI001E2E2F23|nr:SulP family inorganic anion transporter [Amphritea pacifica]
MSNMRSIARWLPFITWGRTINSQTLRGDLFAGLTGAVLVLPQGVAYALIAGMPPEYGLYTAIITAMVAALFGSSSHLITGPAAPMSIVVMSVASGITDPGNSDLYINTVLTITLLSGLIQLALGILRLGSVVNFISHTVILGFTSGAAILIATSQLKHLTDLPVAAGLSFPEEIRTITLHLSQANTYALIIGIATLISALVIKKLLPRWPNLLIAMLLGSGLCWLIDGQGHGVNMIGALSGSLPAFALPDVSLYEFSQLASGALAIAMLGLLEAVSIARAIALRSNQRIDGNQEFIGQGLANVVGGLFSCFAGSGSFTRSGANFDAGAKTPLAAIFTALMITLVLVSLPDLTGYLPLPAMAGAIILIAWNLIDIKNIIPIFRFSSETAIFIVTLLATLFIELEFAIYLGVLISLVAYLKRTSRPSIINVAPTQNEPKRIIRNIQRYNLQECPQIKILRIDGSLFFGAIDHIQSVLQQSTAAGGPTLKYIIINAKGINFIDLAGIEFLAQESSRLEKRGIQLVICSLKGTIIDEIRAKGFLDKLGSQRIFDTAHQAISYCVPRLDQQVCKECSKKIFTECPR